MSHILVTGGTGLIGTRLIPMLRERGHTIACLVRGGPRDDKLPADVTRYRWQPAYGEIDERALHDADAVIHLAGEGIADKRWSAQRKRDLIDSRTRTIALIGDALRRTQHRVKTIVSASAIGAYGSDTGPARLDETAPRGSDFPAKIVRQWETAVQETAMAAGDLRAVMLRTGIVLSMQGGALPKFLLPVKLGIGSPLGTGRQTQSWIHIDDLCRLYVESVENPSWQGVYNAVAPNPVTNAELVRIVARSLRRPFIAPNVPAFVLKLLLGEMVSLVLSDNLVVPQRLQDKTDFVWRFPTLQPALADLLQRRV